MEVGTESQIKTYRVDGEVGRFEFETYRVERDGAVVVDILGGNQKGTFRIWALTSKLA